MNEDSLNYDIKLDDIFKDIDGDYLVFDYEKNENISISILKNHIVEIRPKENWSGIETLTFTANDSKIEISDDVEVTILPINDAPTSAIIMLAKMTYYEGKYQPAIGNATDVDIPYGDELSFTWYSNISGNNSGNGIEIIGYHYMNSPVDIDSCSINNFDIGIYVSNFQSTMSINYINMFDNTYNIYNNSNKEIDARNNYWGTSDEEVNQNTFLYIWQ